MGCTQITWGVSKRIRDKGIAVLLNDQLWKVGLLVYKLKNYVDWNKGEMQGGIIEVVWESSG